MTEPILEPRYWHDRLASSQERHHSIFLCGKEQWYRIEKLHKEILAEYLHDYDSVLDAGCGYGRLLSMLSPRWNGRYLGIDISPDFIGLAKQDFPSREFMLGDLRQLDYLGGKQFDWAVLISIRPMVIRNLGGEEWDKMHAELRRVAKRLLFLEYDEKHPMESLE
jgi:SAM-dependent methyltransferase